jgi:hypothetical protein
MNSIQIHADRIAYRYTILNALGNATLISRDFDSSYECKRALEFVIGVDAANQVRMRIEKW